MAGPNAVVIALLREHAELIRASGGDPSESMAYERAARAVAAQSRDISGLSVEATARIPGVGRPIAEEIAGFLDTGHVECMDVLGMRAVEGTFVPTRGGR